MQLWSSLNAEPFDTNKLFPSKGNKTSFVGVIRRCSNDDPYYVVTIHECYLLIDGKEQRFETAERAAWQYYILSTIFDFVHNQSTDGEFSLKCSNNLFVRAQMACCGLT